MWNVNSINLLFILLSCLPNIRYIKILESNNFWIQYIYQIKSFEKKYATSMAQLFSKYYYYLSIYLNFCNSHKNKNPVSFEYIVAYDIKVFTYYSSKINLFRLIGQCFVAVVWLPLVGMHKTKKLSGNPYREIHKITP